MKTQKLTQNSYRVLNTLVLVSIVFLSGCACLPPLKVYDFEDGTIQGWKITAVSDDQQNSYTPFWLLEHSGTKKNNKTGYLVINAGQFSSWSTLAGFPGTSQYWEVTAYQPCLNAQKSLLWQNIKGVEVDLLDEFGTGKPALEATIGIRVEIGGQSKEIMEKDAQGNPVIHQINHASQGTWTHLKANLNVPSNAIVHQVWIKFRGDLKPGLWEAAGIYIDNVEPF